MKVGESDQDSNGVQNQTDAQPEHHCVYCPNCSQRLNEFRCKLVCPRCGYYLSCADYY